MSSPFTYFIFGTVGRQAMGRIKNLYQDLKLRKSYKEIAK